MSTSQYIPVSKSIHKGFGYESLNGFSFMKDWSFIPIASSEIPQLVSVYPLVFQKSEKGYQLGILTGLVNKNYLINAITNEFVLPYVPALLRTYPFRASKTNQGDAVLSVASSEEGFAENRGNAILDGDGEPTQVCHNLMQLLSRLNAVFDEDKKRVAALEKAQVFKPFEFTVQGAEADSPLPAPKNIYIVDEKALNALDAADFTELRDLGAFSFIYGHLFSLGMMERFSMLDILHTKLQTQSVAKTESVNEFFNDEDGVLKFD